MFKILLLNIKDYGLKNIIFILIYELIYFFNYKYRKTLFLDETSTNEYETLDKKKLDLNSKFNSPYLPTPFYFLEIVKRFIINYSLKDFYYIDFGCGAGRTLHFFKKNFKHAIGVDLNDKYKKFIDKNCFFQMDLRNLNNVNIVKRKTNSKKYVLFFFEPFDMDLIEDIIKKFSEKKIIVILINCNILKNINFKKIFSKYFANNKKNISIYSNFLILKYNRND